MNDKGFTIIELGVVIGLFSLVYFVGVSSVTHAFEVNPKENEYDNIVNIIEKQAEIYAFTNENIFEDGNIVYLYVSDLIEANYIVTDENGNVIDPLSPNKNLNDLKLKIIKEEENITASIVTI